MAWPKGRPRAKLPPERKLYTQNVRLRADTIDQICRFAIHKQMSVSRVVRITLENVFEFQTIEPTTIACYREQASTLSRVLSSDRGAVSPR